MGDVMSDKVLLFIGSPKVGKSVSGTIGEYLCRGLEKRGVGVETVNIYKSLKTEDQFKTLAGQIQSAGSLVFIGPLYVDSLPAKVIEVLEFIYKENKHAGSSNAKRFSAISVCGFPEASQNSTALDIYQCFCQRTGFKWIGGLGIGMAEAFLSMSEKKAYPLLRHVYKSFDMFADATAKGEKLPDQAVRLAARPVLPKWLFLLIATVTWKKAAKKNNVQDCIDAMPYR